MNIRRERSVVVYSISLLSSFLRSFTWSSKLKEKNPSMCQKVIQRWTTSRNSVSEVTESWRLSDLHRRARSITANYIVFSTYHPFVLSLAKWVTISFLYSSDPPHHIFYQQQFLRSSQQHDLVLRTLGALIKKQNESQETLTTLLTTVISQQQQQQKNSTHSSRTINVFWTS